MPEQQRALGSSSGRYDDATGSMTDLKERYSQRQSEIASLVEDEERRLQSSNSAPRNGRAQSRTSSIPNSAPLHQSRSSPRKRTNTPPTSESAMRNNPPERAGEKARREQERKEVNKVVGRSDGESLDSSPSPRREGHESPAAPRRNIATPRSGFFSKRLRSTQLDSRSRRNRFDNRNNRSRSREGYSPEGRSFSPLPNRRRAARQRDYSEHGKRHQERQRQETHRPSPPPEPERELESRSSPQPPNNGYSDLPHPEDPAILLLAFNIPAEKILRKRRVLKRLSLDFHFYIAKNVQEAIHCLKNSQEIIAAIVVDRDVQRITSSDRLFDALSTAIRENGMRLILTWYSSHSTPFSTQHVTEFFDEFQSTWKVGFPNDVKFKLSESSRFKTRFKNAKAATQKTLVVRPLIGRSVSVRDAVYIGPERTGEVPLALTRIGHGLLGYIGWLGLDNIDMVETVYAILGYAKEVPEGRDGDGSNKHDDANAAGHEGSQDED